jgi:hypothetical protein
MTKKKPGAPRGRPPVPIERDPLRFQIACIWAFLGFGLGPFDATNRALMVVRGGPISMSDIMEVLRLSQVSVRFTIRYRCKFEPFASGRARASDHGKDRSRRRGLQRGLREFGWVEGLAPSVGYLKIE